MQMRRRAEDKSHNPINRLLECWLRVREVMGSILSQGQCHTKDVMKMVPCLALNIEKGNTGSQELR